jgi:hypothetical protein
MVLPRVAPRPFRQHLCFYSGDIVAGGTWSRRSSLPRSLLMSISSLLKNNDRCYTDNTWFIQSKSGHKGLADRGRDTAVDA